MREGDLLDDTAIGELAAESTTAAALDTAYRYLGNRPRSAAEVRTRLRRGGYDPGVIDHVLARLADLKLLDDAAFADYWVEQRARFSPRSARAVTQELRAKGVEREVAAEATGALDDAASALALARPRWERTAGLEPRTRRDRLARWLVSRGYAWDTISSVLRQLGGADPDD